MTQIRLVLMYFFMVAHLKHVCASVTDKADRSVVLTLLQAAFLGSVMTKNLVDRLGYSPVSQILLQIVVTVVITFSPPIWSSSAGML